jgi:hypothetical protein
MKLRSGESVTVDILGTARKLFWDVVKFVALCGTLALAAAIAPIVLFVLPQVLIIQDPQGDFSGLAQLFFWASPFSVALWMAFLCHWHSRRLWQREGKDMSEWREAHGGFVGINVKSTGFMFLGLFGSFACEVLLLFVFRYHVAEYYRLFFALFPFVSYAPVILLFIKRHYSGEHYDKATGKFYNNYWSQAARMRSPYSYSTPDLERRIKLLAAEQAKERAERAARGASTESDALFRDFDRQMGSRSLLDEERQKEREKQEFERERESITREYKGLTEKFTKLVSDGSSAWDELMRTANVLDGINDESAPFRDQVEIEARRIIKAFSVANGSTPDGLGRMFHALIVAGQRGVDAEVPKDITQLMSFAGQRSLYLLGANLRTPAECVEKSIQWIEETNHTRPDVLSVEMLGEFDKLRKTHLAADAADAYHSLVIRASECCSASIAVDALRTTYFTLLQPYIPADFNHDRESSSDVPSEAEQAKARFETNSKHNPALGLKLNAIKEDCQLIGVDEYYTLDELNAARRTKAAQWHPDKLGDMAPELKEFASEHLTRLNLAYERLEKHVKWDTEYKTITAVCEDVLNCDWAQLAQLPDAMTSSDASRIENAIERFDDGIRRIRACLARVQQETPTMDVTVIKQIIAESIALSRRVKSNLPYAQAGNH